MVFFRLDFLFIVSVKYFRHFPWQGKKSWVCWSAYALLGLLSTVQGHSFMRNHRLVHYFVVNFSINYD